MLEKPRKRIKRPRRKVLVAVAEGLREIEAHFEWEGFSEVADKQSQGIPERVVIQAGESGAKAEDGELVEPDGSSEGEETQPEESEESYDDFESEEEPEGESVFQREEIEVAIDLFVTHLIEEEIIEEPENLEHIFGALFGEDHEITEAVKAFEEHIKGYFGAIAHEDMNKAFGNLTHIRDILEKEMARHAKN